MLLKLTITDLAVVKALSLEFQPGMSVLTGETGAGKSILLTALGLALGQRAEASFIRPGNKRAEITLEFDLSTLPQTAQWLIDNDLDSEQDCLLRRVINGDGRSKAYINGRSVTLQTLQQLSEQLIEIHGQHAYLRLLNAEEQRRLLDNYTLNQPECAATSTLLESLNQVFYAWQQAQQNLQRLQHNRKTAAERRTLLEYQLQELQQLDLRHFNYNALSEEHAKLAHLEDILTIGQSQLDNLLEAEQQSAQDRLSHSIQALKPLLRYAPDLQPIIAQLTEAQVQLVDAAQELRRYLQAQEIDPAKLAFLEAQLSLIHSLSRKHQVRPEALVQQASELQQELQQLSQNSEQLTQLHVEVQRLESRYQTLAAQLSTQRQASGLKLQRLISELLKTLGMPQGELLVQLTPLTDSQPRLNGLDKIDFLISTNPGLPAQPLAKIASGGELSRISLAIQVITSNAKTIPTMIFDEVDAGIGGGIAEIVGQKLRTLSQQRQVLCVTHLPQVAAQAHHHLYVSKQHSDTTTSSVTQLSTAERIQELARMLGGVEITAHTVAHAQEMLTKGTQQP